MLLKGKDSSVVSLDLTRHNNQGFDKGTNLFSDLSEKGWLEDLPGIWNFIKTLLPHMCFTQVINGLVDFKFTK